MQFNRHDVNLLEESAKRGKGYWFPYWFRYIAWFLTTAIIIACSFCLIFYGLTFGLVKCYLWLTAVFTSVFLSGFFVQPARIFIVTAILAAISKSPPKLILKKVPREILENPYDEAKTFQALRYRLEKSSLYAPLPKYKLERRMENIKFHLEQRNLFVEVSIYIVFASTLVYLLLAQRSWAMYYSTSVAKELVVFGSYTNTIPFTEVRSYGQFIEYLNETLFPSLIESMQEEIRTTKRSVNNDFRRSFRPWGRSSKSKKRSQKLRRMLLPPKSLTKWDERSTLNARKLYLSRLNKIENNVTSIYERSWTLDHSVKMIGKPRMRQLRVKNNSCKASKFIEPRGQMCFSEYSWYNQEKGDFTLWWSTVQNEILTPMELKPWIYENSWTNGGIYLVGKHSSYPSGGYILEFAKHLEDCRIILDYMDAFQWIDARTRAVIIEFTLYSVNVNLFSVVHLIVEKSASGFFLPSYQIDTAKFMFLAGELELLSVVMIIVFVLLIFLFALRQALRVERTSLYSYLMKGNPTVDILIIVFGLISVAFIFLRSYYVSSLFNTLEKSQNNAFVSFAYAAIWNSITTYILAALVILTAIKLLHILRFRVVFLQLQQILLSSYRYFFVLSLFLFVVLCAFSIFFHLVLASYDYQFSTIGRTMSKLIGLIACVGKSCDRSVYSNSPWFLAPVFYMFYLLSVLIFVVALFVSVICHSLAIIKKTQISNKYNALAYLKHVLTANDRSDILRLRGGGTTCSRIWFGDKKKYNFPPKNMVDRVVIKGGEPIFTHVNIYDFQSPYCVTDPYQFEIMKRLTKARLANEEEMEKTERLNAMKVITAQNLIPTDSRKLMFPEKFYRVRDENEKWVVSRKTLLKMRKITDKYGQEKLLEKYNNAGLELKLIGDHEEDYSQFLSALDKKFSELKLAAGRKYQEEKKQEKASS